MSGVNDMFGQFGNIYENILQDQIGNDFPVDGNDVDINVNDPHPDIYELFNYYTSLYFEGRLDGVSVEWSSKRMTSCGGTCQSVPGGAIIKLSQPLLILRPSRDLKMVLLHEMIHAYCMVHKIRDPDPSGHGPPFQSLMNKINSSTVFDFHRPRGGYNISVYHTMFNEVEYYRQHHWKCERCGSEVHRAMNRKPQEADCRLRFVSRGGGDGATTSQQCSDTRCNWHMHLRHCGGEFIKIKEPEEYAQKNKKKKQKREGQDTLERQGHGSGSSATGSGSALPTGQRSIAGWLKPPAMPNSSAGDGTLPAINAVLQGNRGGYTSNGETEKVEKTLPVAVEERRALFEAAALRRFVSTTKTGSPSGNSPKQNGEEQQLEVIDLVDDEDAASLPGAPSLLPPPPPSLSSIPLRTSIHCPICGAEFPANQIAALNAHVDGCLALAS